jgi:hypothetical protein
MNQLGKQPLDGAFLRYYDLYIFIQIQWLSTSALLFRKGTLLDCIYFFHYGMVPM